MKYLAEARILADIEGIAKKLAPGCEYVSWASTVHVERGVMRRKIFVSALDAQGRIITTWSAELQDAETIEILVHARSVMLKEQAK